MKKNTCIKARRSTPRKLSGIDQKEDLDAWKKNHEYEHRGVAESVFSAFKRIFREHAKAVKWKNMVKELILKASIYKVSGVMNPKRFG